MPVARTDGRAGGRMVTWLPNFLGWVDYFIFLPMVLRCARLASEISAKNLYLLTTGENWRFLMVQLHLMLLNGLFGNFSLRQAQVSCMFWIPLQNLPYLSPRVCTGGRSNAYVITIFFSHRWVSNDPYACFRQTSKFLEFTLQNCEVLHERIPKAVELN